MVRLPDRQTEARIIRYLMAQATKVTTTVNRVIIIAMLIGLRYVF